MTNLNAKIESERNALQQQLAAAQAECERLREQLADSSWLSAVEEWNALTPEQRAAVHGMTVLRAMTETADVRRELAAVQAERDGLQKRIMWIRENALQCAMTDEIKANVEVRGGERMVPYDVALRAEKQELAAALRSKEEECERLRRDLDTFGTAETKELRNIINQAVAGQWISVGERLPGPGEYLFAMGAGRRFIATVGDSRPDGWNGITHWLRIPPLPTSPASPTVHKSPGVAPPIPCCPHCKTPWDAPGCCSECQHDRRRKPAAPTGPETTIMYTPLAGEAGRVELLRGFGLPSSTCIESGRGRL